MLVAKKYSCSSWQLADLRSSIRGLWRKECLKRTQVCLRVVLLGFSHPSWFPMMQTLSRGERGDDLIGLENSFGSKTHKCQWPIYHCPVEYRPLSTRMLRAFELCALNPTDTWAFNKYTIMCAANWLYTCMYMYRSIRVGERGHSLLHTHQPHP